MRLKTLNVKRRSINGVRISRGNSVEVVRHLNENYGNAYDLWSVRVTDGAIIHDDTMSRHVWAYEGDWMVIENNRPKSVTHSKMREAWVV